MKIADIRLLCSIRQNGLEPVILRAAARFGDIDGGCANLVAVRGICATVGFQKTKHTKHSRFRDGNSTCAR